MKKFCDMCGRPISGGVVMGNALTCRTCAPDLQQDIQAVRETGKPVNALHIAKRKFREENDLGTYILRDIPPDLWEKCKHKTIEENCSLRELILTSLYQITQS